MRGQNRNSEDQATAKTMFAAGIAPSIISAQLKIPERTLYQWRQIWEEKGDKEYAELRIAQKNRFIDQAQRIIDKASNLLEIKIDKAVKSEKEGLELLEQLERTLREAGASEETIKSQVEDLRKVINKSTVDNVSQISTVLGTIYDKKALAEGKSTQNMNLTFEGFIDKIGGDSEF